MFLEVVIVLALAVLGVTMYFKYREKPVDMNHKAPNVHNVVENAVNGPAPAAPAKKVAKKKVAKKKAVKK